MASSLAHRWTAIDILLQRWRFGKVIPLIPEGALVVDLGCGDGDFLRAVSPRIKKGYGFDRLVTADAGMGNLEIHTLPEDGRVPLGDECADVVTALAVLEHASDSRQFVAEAFRILKPGGVCIMTTPAPRGKALLEFLAYRLKIISEADIRDHKHYYRPDELRTLFHGFGRTDVDFFQFGLNTRVVGVK